MDFRVLPSGDLTLTNLTSPGCLTGAATDLQTVSLTLRGGRIAAPAPDLPQVDMAGAMVFPGFVDMHTHLDKGHIWSRAPNPDGTFDGALATVEADRMANWSGPDVRARMDFALRCAYAHGTRAIRTHLDSIPPQGRISFPEFTRLRDEWAGRIELQAACLTLIDLIDPDGGGGFADLADLVAESGGVLGCVTFPDARLQDRLRAFFGHAGRRGLHADFHSDETGDPDSATLRVIAETVLETGFDAPVTVGHCCSLSVQPDAEWLHTLDLVARAGINVVSLPLCWCGRLLAPPALWS